MTISNQVSSVTAEGNGSTTSWTFTFLIPTTASCFVQVYDTTVDPATTTSISSSQFSVTGIGVTSGGVLTYPLSGSPLSTGQYLTISRDLPYTQETSIRNQGNFYPAAVENALDYLTMLTQQLNAMITEIEAQLENPNQPVLPEEFTVVDNIGQLKALTVGAGSTVYCLGHTTPGDGGGGFFLVTTTDPGDDDNGVNLDMDTAGFYAVRQLFEDTVSPKFFGAYGDGTTNDTTALQNAYTWARLNGGGTIKYDGLFAVQPASDGAVIIKVGSGTKSVAASRDYGVTVKNDAGNYQAVFADYSSATPSENLQFVGFTINQNAAGNTTCNITPNVLTKALCALYFIGPNIYVKDMLIENAPGVNTFSLNGVAANSITVDGCEINWREGTSTTSNYDNSAIYINATHWQVTNNYIKNVGTIGKATTALETHGSYGQVYGNQVYGYFTVGLIVTNGTTSSEFVNVSMNEANYCRNGFTLWSETTASIKSMVVSGNVLSLTSSAFPSSVSLQNGIGLYYSAATTGNYENIDICDNVIVMEQSQSTTTSQDSGGIALETYGTMSRIRVHDNVVKNAPYNGIVLRNVNATAAYQISIKNNYLVDCGNNTTSAQRYSILMTGKVIDSIVSDNQVVETGATLVGSVSYDFSNLSSGSAVIERNNTSYSITATTSQIYNGSLLTRPEKMQQLTWTASMAPVINTGVTRVEVTASTTASCTIFAPAVEGASVGARVKFFINNTSGGTLALSWSGFKMESWTQPTSGQAAYIEFENRGSGVNWYQCAKQVTFTK